MKDISGKPLIQCVWERVLASDSFDEVVIATSVDKDDDPIELFCRTKGAVLFRGNLDDVLDRFYHAAKYHEADHVARFTGDCALIDPEVIKKAVKIHHEGGFDYTSNVVERTYPDGLDTEIISFSTLKRTCEEATLKSEREHVTPYIYKNPDKFSLGHVVNDKDYSELRWVIDEPRDLIFVREVYSSLESDIFGMEEILELLKEKPELSKINEGIMLNEGYEKSLREDFMVKNS